MRLSEFDYTLPEELIAQEPLEERDQSRLLVVDRKTGRIEHRHFPDLLEYLADDDLMVFNDTRVAATRLLGNKETGARVEALLLRRREPGVWESIVKPGRRVRVGSKLLFESGLTADVVDRTEEGGRVLRFSGPADVEGVIRSIGKVPLPPYIHRELEDAGRYQTVYASADGSAAAPTAGLHFTQRLLDRIKSRGIRTARITLHVGVATFRPVRVENVDDHEMHAEWFEISEETAEVINSAKGRIVCVGTTTARALESAAVAKRRVASANRETRLFIRPPYDFKVVEALITNFHIPRSTLLMMVCAFAGTQLVRKAYEEAVRERYRFLSFGDAMLLH